MNMQLKRDEVDKSNKKEDVVKNLQRAIESVLTPSPSKPPLTALADAKKRKARVQAKKRRKFVKTSPFFAQVARRREEKR